MPDLTSEDLRKSGSRLLLLTTLQRVKLTLHDFVTTAWHVFWAFDISEADPQRAW